MTMKSQYKRKGPAKSISVAKSEMKKQFDGDSHFCYNMTILIGSSAEVVTRDGKKFEGVFVAFSSKQEVMLEAAHLVEEDNESIILQHFDALVIPSDKVLAVRFEDVDLSYATRDFQLDSVIAGSRTSTHGDKELTPWDGADNEPSEDLYLDPEENQNGWEAQEMFKKNEENFGIISSYTQDLVGYTTRLDKSDLETFKKHEEEAAHVASEIERNSSALDSNLENCDEEDAFSAVIRPSQPTTNIIISPNLTAGSTANDKYIPPSRRSQQSHTGVPPVLSQSSGLTNGLLPASSSNTLAGGSRKPIYGAHQRSNFGQTSNNGHHERRQYESRRPQGHNQFLGGGYGDCRRSEDLSRLVKLGNRQSKDTFPDRQMGVPIQRFGGGKIINTHVQAPDHVGKREESLSPALQPLMPRPCVSSNASPTTNPTSSEASAPKNVSSMKTSDKAVVAVDLKTAAATPAPQSDPESSLCESGSDVDQKSTKFTFNPNAKEFNPAAKSFTRKSPSPSPNAIATSAQMVHSTFQSYVPAPASLYNSQQQQSQITIPSSTNPSILGVSNQRPVMHHRKGASQRGDGAQQMQIQGTGPSLIASAGLQAAGPHPQYTIIPSAYSQQVRIHPQNMMPIYSEGGGAAQLHLPLHYFQNNTAVSQNNPTQQPSNVGPPSAVSNTAHGYQHGHYPFVGLPMVGWSQPHNHSQMMSGYVPHPGNANGVLPHNQ